MQSFVIVTQPRSGSTLLQRALASHPAVRCEGELFNPDLPPNPDPADFTARLYGGQDARQAVGFKLIDNQPRLPNSEDPDEGPWATVRRSLRRVPGLKVVFLLRPDTLARYVSGRWAARTLVWHMNHASRDGRVYPFEIDVEAYAAWVGRAWKQWEREQAAWADVPSITVLYDDLDRHFDATTSRVQTFLGVEPRRLPATATRTATVPLPDLLTNYDELVARHVAIQGAAVGVGEPEGEAGPMCFRPAPP